MASQRSGIPPEAPDSAVRPVDALAQMSEHPSRALLTGRLNAEALQLYRDAIAMLQASGVPFLVGGAHALVHYAGLTRLTGDVDLFVRPNDVGPALDALAAGGFEVEMAFSHWLGKAKRDGLCIDIIFSSGNALAEVDDEWFAHAVCARVFGLDVLLIPPEELIWVKAYVMERERYDGADVAHVLRALAEQLDWRRLMERFGSHWHVLLSHLVLFEFIYPGALRRVPVWVLDDLVAHLTKSVIEPPVEGDDVCRGTLLSRAQYLTDVTQLGYKDPRVDPHGRMSEDEVTHWTRAIGEK